MRSARERRLLAPAMAALLPLACSAPSHAPAVAPAAPPAQVHAPTTQVEGFVRELRSIDVDLAGKGHLALDTLVTRPVGTGRVPLVLLSHGSPRDAADRVAASPTAFAGPSMELARRGYGVAAVLRRGFGATGGEFAEDPGPCENRDYLRGTRFAAEDILGAVDALKKEEWVDPTRIVLLGHSAGGFASLAAAAANPDGLVAVVSFAGGRGSDSPGHVCQPERLVDAATTFGATARAPSLWIFAENDLFFSPPLATALKDGFASHGAPVELVIAPPYGDDGHGLFLATDTQAWWPLVAPFLAQHHLPVDLLSPRVLPRLDPPQGLSEKGRLDFGRYLATEAFEKAFATNGTAWGWATGKRTLAEASDAALQRCQKHATSPCSVFALGDASAR
jgi:dienelactone hydrolase